MATAGDVRAKLSRARPLLSRDLEREPRDPVRELEREENWTGGGRSEGRGRNVRRRTEAMS